VIKLGLSMRLYILCSVIFLVTSCQQQQEEPEIVVPAEQLSIVAPPELKEIMQQAVASFPTDSNKLPNGAKIEFSITELNSLTAAQKIARGQIKSALWVAPSMALVEYTNAHLINLGAKQINCRKIFSTRLVAAVGRAQRKKILPIGTVFSREKLQALEMSVSVGIPRADLSDNGLAAASYLLFNEGANTPVTEQLFLTLRRYGNDAHLLQNSAKNYFGIPRLSLTSEQQLIHYNQQIKNNDEMIEALYPSDGAPSLDYTACLSEADWMTHSQKSAGALFQKHLLSQKVQVAAQQAGFRALQYVSDSIDSFTPALGVKSTPEEQTNPITTEQIDKALSNQDLLSPRTTTIFVVDCSGSMQGTSLLTAKRLIRAAIEREPEANTIGLISFSSTPELISAPVGDTKSLLPYVAGLQANGGSSLYDAILLGAEILQKPEYATVQRRLVVITDGNDQNSKTSLAFFGNSFQRRAGTQGLALSLFFLENSSADTNDLKQINELINGTLRALSPAITAEEFIRQIQQS